MHAQNCSDKQFKWSTLPIVILGRHTGDDVCRMVESPPDFNEWKYFCHLSPEMVSLPHHSEPTVCLFR